MRNSYETSKPPSFKAYFDKKAKVKIHENPKQLKARGGKYAADDQSVFRTRIFALKTLEFGSFLHRIVHTFYTVTASFKNEVRRDELHRGGEGMGRFMETTIKTYTDAEKYLQSLYQYLHDLSLNDRHRLALWNFVQNNRGERSIQWVP